MELPVALKRAVDAALEGHAVADLARAASTLSARYRAEVRDGAFHLAGDRAALAYLATRLPATYAAVSAALATVAEERPDFSPETLLDVGAGPGTALWATASQWPSCRKALLVEGSASIRRWGEKLSASLTGEGGSDMCVVWQSQNIVGDAAGSSQPEQHDLVTMAYVLDEIEERDRDGLIERLWARTRDVLVIVEPGTPAGFRRVEAVRRQLIDAGGHIVAPCPHELPCPVIAPDWCHFAQRVARSKMHRMVKGGDVPWEDEKYAFVAVSRTSGSDSDNLASARILAPPRAGKGHISLKLCEADGSIVQRTVSRRDGDTYRIARRAGWGDSFP